MLTRWFVWLDKNNLLLALTKKIGSNHKKIVIFFLLTHILSFFMRHLIEQRPGAISSMLMGCDSVIHLVKAALGHVVDQRVSIAPVLLVLDQVILQPRRHLDTRRHAHGGGGCGRTLYGR